MVKDIHKDKILIMDFGSQYTKLIARRLRELGVYCELSTWNLTEKQIYNFNPNGIILSGGPNSTLDSTSPQVPTYVFKIGCPILGICYGMQTMALQLGGKVEQTDKREFGYAQVKIINKSLLTDKIQDNFHYNKLPLLDVWMSHGDQVIQVPSNFVIIGVTNLCPIAIMADEKRQFYGVQFHPEVTQTKSGQRLLKNFIYKICKCEGNWTPVEILKDIENKLYHKVGNCKSHVILGFSGGVDSCVTAILLNRIIGNRLTCIFIDNGLLRLNEANEVMELFKDFFGLNIIYIQAEQIFLSALAGITDPEEKRKIIGGLFLDIFNQEAKKLYKVKWLAQGTIYPDIIESSLVGSEAHMIKSHHNVGGLPKQIPFDLIEPLKELFKDEVRQIGLELNIPYKILYRHPFPGPGLGVRILGEIKKEYCDLLRQADAIFLEELYNSGLYYKVSQAFAIFIPVRSVGIMGDIRNYDWVISLRAIKTVDFMTASWVHLPYNLLGHIANRIINEVKGISRVVYDISSKPPSTIEWE
ncbi:MAG: glutamine-hydrolyzing GMP synthase [Candidatus Dasytiphilus stammeri]